jgi:hypothetical protein
MEPAIQAGRCITAQQYSLLNDYAITYLKGGNISTGGKIVVYADSTGAGID